MLTFVPLKFIKAPRLLPRAEGLAAFVKLSSEPSRLVSMAQANTMAVSSSLSGQKQLTNREKVALLFHEFSVNKESRISFIM